MINIKDKIWLKKINQLNNRINPCYLCPHHCGTNRLNSNNGKCRTGNEIKIASSNLHFGEEPPISGTKGSGTIFFCNCNLSCVFCQNYPISQLGHGNTITISKLASIMLDLQTQGAQNINLVTPTHAIAHIVQAIYEAKLKGLNIPLVYNCSGFEDIETLKLLDGIIDIYIPDAKYSNNYSSQKYSNIKNYWDINKKALKEMHRQTGILSINEKGIAVKGLLIRHLILPNNISGSKIILNFIANELSKQTYISLMSQYHPAYQSEKFPELSKKISKKEYEEVIQIAHSLGLENGWQQDF